MKWISCAMRMDFVQVRIVMSGGRREVVNFVQCSMLIKELTNATAFFLIVMIEEGRKCYGNCQDLANLLSSY